MAKLLVRWVRSDAGGTAAEYAIVASLIAAVIAGTVALIGARTAQFFVIPWP